MATELIARVPTVLSLESDVCLMSLKTERSLSRITRSVKKMM